LKPPLAPIASLWETLADQSLHKQGPSLADAKRILEAEASETFSILNAAYRVRYQFHGNKVKIHVLQNAKSGACSEDCGFCSQS